MEQYLARCLDSVVASKYLDRLEILVVNDGSKDRSLEIASEYEFRYPNSVRVIDKPNGGWGSAINLSIREAKGKYYKSLDSDDWFDTSGLDAFIEELLKVDVDLVVTNLTEVYADGKKREIEHNSLYGSGFTDIDAMLEKNNCVCNIQIHSLTFLTKMMQGNNIRVSECYYADLDFITIPMLYVEKAYVSSYNVYQYYLGRDGQSVSVVGYQKHFKDYLRVCVNQLRFFKNLPSSLPSNKRKMFDHKILGHCKWAYQLALSPNYATDFSKTEIKVFDIEMKTHNPHEYRLLNRTMTMKVIPYIFIWRKTGINCLKLTYTLTKICR